MEKATFGAGCFWGVEAAFRCVDGVVDTRVGYTGGNLPNPSYSDVCSGVTGHTEAVEVIFDPAQVSYPQLLDTFWSLHDPTVESKTQYQSVIFFHTPEQREEAMASIDTLKHSRRYTRQILTEVLPATTFYPAEEYHQRYYEKTGRRSCDRR